MAWRGIRSFLVRLANVTGLRGDGADRDFSDELESHIQLHTADNMKSGLSPAEARRQAILRLGGIEGVKEQRRDGRGFEPLSGLAQDLNHAARRLRRSPGFALLAGLSLALGIGATVALFTFVDAVLLRPPPIAGADRLAWLEEIGADGQVSGGTPSRLADWRVAESVSGVAGFYTEDIILSGRGPLRRLHTLRTFGPAADVLRYPLAMGRAPALDEARGLRAVAVISYPLWRTLFQSDPAAIGAVLNLGGAPYEVIGVLGKDVQYPEALDAWAPAPRDLQGVSRAAGFLAQVARLRDGVDIHRAQAEMDGIARNLARAYPLTDQGRRIRLTPLREHVSAGARKPLLLLFGAVASVLLIACVNIAGLLAARGLGRRREASIRAALGAGRARLVRLFFCEGLLLAMLGGAGGLAVAWYGIEALKRLLPDDLPRLSAASLDPRALGFAALAVLLCALAAGLAPAWQFASAGSLPLNEGGQRAIGERSRWLRPALVVVEVACSSVLLVFAGLLGGSYVRLHDVSLGFNPRQAGSLTVPFAWTTPPDRLDAFAGNALERIGGVAGVRAVGIVDALPLHGGTQSSPVVVRGRSFPRELARRSIGWRAATPGYFAAAGVPVMAGVLFASYTEKGARTVVVNQTLGRLLFGGESPVGREIAQAPREGGAPKWWRIAGVVGDVRQTPSEATEPEVFAPWGSTYWPVMNFTARADLPAASLAREIRAAVQSITTDQIIGEAQPLTDLTEETRSAPRTRAGLVLAFAAAATVLAGIGLFGLLSQEVVRRAPEFGVRLALGADPRAICLQTAMSGLRLVLLGLAVGMGVSLALTRWIGSLLYGVSPNDALTLVASAGAMLVTAVAATILPALRAARTDPIVALREA